MRIFLIILAVILVFVGLVFIIVKKDEAASKKRRESGIDKKIIEDFLENNYPTFNSNWITGWNTYVEKKGRYVTTWRYRYLILFNKINNYFDLVSIDFSNDALRKLSEERIALSDIKLEVVKDIATITIGDSNNKDRFIIESISNGNGKVDDGNPFALDQNNQFNDFIQFARDRMI